MIDRKDREKRFPKFSAGAFTTSPIDNVLREYGIATIFATGTDTCGCVESTISEASDRSYQIILVDDACCSVRPELHEAAIKIWKLKGYVRQTEQVLLDYPWTSWIDKKIVSR